MAAAKQAIDEAGVEPKTKEDAERTGVLIGSGIGGLGGIYEASITLHEKGPRRISPFFIPGRLINLASGYVSIRFGLKGPNHSVVTACSTGAHAIGDSWRLIAMGDADVMVAGGAESAVNRISLAGFAACRALSHQLQRRARRRPRAPTTRTATASSWARAPASSCSRNTSGPRRAAPRSTARSSATACRATPTTSPRPSEDGDGGFRCMQAAVKRAGISAGRHRLHQRPRHLDAARRRDRARRGDPAARQRRGRRRDVLDQIGDRAPARRGGLGRGDLLPARDARRHRAADDQSRQSRRSRRRSTSCRTSRSRRRSMSRCRTPSASAAPTPR